MYFNPKNRKIWANAMREKILGRLHCSYTVIRTSTGDKFSHYQFREAAHVPTGFVALRSSRRTAPQGLHHPPERSVSGRAKGTAQ